MDSFEDLRQQLQAGVPHLHDADLRLPLARCARRLGCAGRRGRARTGGVGPAALDRRFCGPAMGLAAWQPALARRTCYRTTVTCWG